MHQLDFNEQVLQSELPVLVDYWAEWCAPCKALAPVLDEVAEEYRERLKRKGERKGVRANIYNFNPRIHPSRTQRQFIAMTPLNFDEQVLQSAWPVRVDYWAEWCAPCKSIPQDPMKSILY